jgi:hypothetical protein
VKIKKAIKIFKSNKKMALKRARILASSSFDMLFGGDKGTGKMRLHPLLGYLTWKIGTTEAQRYKISFLPYTFALGRQALQTLDTLWSP